SRRLSRDRGMEMVVPGADVERPLADRPLVLHERAHLRIYFLAEATDRSCQHLDPDRRAVEQVGGANVAGADVLVADIEADVAARGIEARFDVVGAGDIRSRALHRAALLGLPPAHVPAAARLRVRQLVEP